MWITDGKKPSDCARACTNCIAALDASLCTRQFMESQVSRRRAPSGLRAFLLFVGFNVSLTHFPRGFMRIVVGTIAVMVAAGLPLDVNAQTADSLPFRAGQWGAEFSVNQSFGSAGLLKFRSKRTAWMFDISTSIRSGTHSGNLSGTDHSAADLRIGPRWYRPIASRLFQYASLGPSVGYSRDESSSESGNTRNTFTQRSTSYGLFGELGAGWLVSPQLSLGASWGARAGYSRVTTNQSIQNFEYGGRSSQGFADLGIVSLRLGLFF